MAKQVLWRLTLSYKNWKNNRILQKSGSVWIWILGVGVTGMLNLGDVKFRVCWILEVHWQGWRAWNLAVGCLRNLLFLKIFGNRWCWISQCCGNPYGPTTQPLIRGDCYWSNNPHGSTVDPWGLLRLNRWPVGISTAQPVDPWGLLRVNPLTRSNPRENFRKSSKTFWKHFRFVVFVFLAKSYVYDEGFSSKYIRHWCHQLINYISTN